MLTLAAVAVTVSITLLLAIFATLPYRVDRLLLLNDDLCTVSREDEHSTVRWGLTKRLNTCVESILFNFLVVHIWDRNGVASDQKESYDECNSSDEATSSSVPNRLTKQSLHPMCQRYREFRSTVQIEHICISWNWYYSCQFYLRQIAVRSSANRQPSATRPVYVLESLGTYCISLHSTNPQPMQLPPAITIQSIDVNFLSWTKPVVSTKATGIDLNVVMQKGRLSMPNLPKLVGIHPVTVTSTDTNDDDTVSLFLGDMRIQEALSMLPKPPEREGMYPMIGLINVTNVSLNLIERNIKGGRELHDLNTVDIPDEVFRPLLNLTSGEY